MTDADDTLVDLVDLDHFEGLFEQALAPERPGDPTGPDDLPSWVDDLTFLVAEARSAPTDDELRAAPAVVAAMVAERQKALSDVPDLAADDGAEEQAPGLDDDYSPQHIAPAPPLAPAGRQVRRVIAVKAVAVVTAVAVGTVAAAAATTGIVSSVVERVIQPAPPSIDGTPDDEADDATDAGTEDGDTIDISTPSCPEVEPLCSPVRGMAPPPASGDEATDPQTDGDVTADPEAGDATTTADSGVTMDALEPAGTAETTPTTSTSTTPTTAATTTTTTQPVTTTTGDDALPPPARENRNERAGQNGRP
jgi:hypothetical protein